MTHPVRWFNCAVVAFQSLASRRAALPQHTASPVRLAQLGTSHSFPPAPNLSAPLKTRLFVAYVAALALAFATPGSGQDAEQAGAALAAELRAQWPTDNLLQAGWLKMRDAKGNRATVPIRFEVIVTATNWMSIFTAFSSNALFSTEQLCVVHSCDCPGQYNWTRTNTHHGQQSAPIDGQQISWTGARWQYAFAGSDFWAVDLGLEFLCWPGQRLLKREMRRSRMCNVLESTNPAPAPDGYSRVVSWIDTETGGLVRAEAYDAHNRLLKEFEPKEFKKVKGRWELRQMRIRNVQTGSQTVFELDQSIQ